MAIGDKLYLADKETLDAVNNKADTIQSSVDSTKSTVNETKTNSQTLLINTNTTNTKLGNTTDNAGTFSVFSFLKNILNNTISLINSSKVTNYTTTSKVHHSSAKVPAGTLATVFSSTKSGRLYSVIVTGKANMNFQLRITVDNAVIVYMYCNSSASYYAGLVVGNKNATHGIQGTVKNIETATKNFSSELQTTGIFYSPLPIKVNNSVLIELVNGSNISDTPDLEYTYVED